MWVCLACADICENVPTCVCSEHGPLCVQLMLCRFVVCGEVVGMLVCLWVDGWVSRWVCGWVCGSVGVWAMCTVMCEHVRTCVLLCCAVHYCEVHVLVWECVSEFGGGCHMCGCFPHVVICVGMCPHVFAVGMCLPVYS